MLHAVWTSDLMHVFWFMTIVSPWADPWEKVKEGSLGWEWDEWNLFLVDGITGLLHGTMVMGVSCVAEEQWGRRAGVVGHSKKRLWAVRDPTGAQNTMGGTRRVTEPGSACAMWTITFPEACPRQCQIPSRLSHSQHLRKPATYRAAVRPVGLSAVLSRGLQWLITASGYSIQSCKSSVKIAKQQVTPPYISVCSVTVETDIF